MEKHGKKKRHQVVHEGDAWLVKEADGDKVLGRFATEAEAKAAAARLTEAGDKHPKKKRQHTARMAEGEEVGRKDLGGGVEAILCRESTLVPATVGGYAFDADHFTEAQARDRLLQLTAGRVCKLVPASSE